MSEIASKGAPAGEHVLCKGEATITRPRLRPYQRDDLKKIDDAFRRHGRVLYQAPTGSGKTVAAAAFISRQLDDRIFVLAHRDEIVIQLSDALVQFGVLHGIVAPGYPETGDKIQVASVMTLMRRLHRFTPAPTLLIVDEAHHAAARTWRNIVAAYPDADIFGMTATPRRLDGKPLGDIFDELVIGPSIQQLIDEGWLAPVTVFAPARGPDVSMVKTRAGDYAVDQLGAVMSNSMIVGGAVDEYARIAPGAPAIVFCVNVEHSKLVAAAFRKRGYRAEHVDGDTARDRRRGLISALAKGDLDILTNCGLISEGLDVPGVECVILLRPTRSEGLYLQMVGRALRRGKDMAFVLDHAGNVFRHGLPTAPRHWSLHGEAKSTNAGDNLVRCPGCGAVNRRGADECLNCGAPLPRRVRSPRGVIEGPRLIEVTDQDLVTMNFCSAMKWAADGKERLRKDRLERIAAARGYKSGWVYHNANRPLDEALHDLEKWLAKQGV